MQVLVTGSSGFVGHWMVRELVAAGDQVIELAETVDIRALDALRPEVVAAQPDFICHLAAQASVAESWKDPADTLSTNVIGTSNVLEAALGCTRPPRVLIVSSAEVYGTVAEVDLPLMEERPLAPATPYAASKAGAEMVGLQAFLGRGLEVIRARPFNHTGPGQRRDYVVPSLAAQVAGAAHGGVDRLAVGNLEAKRDFTDVRDVVAAYRLLMTSGAPGEVYNVCSGVSVSVSEIAERLLTIAGLDLPVWVDPDLVRPIEVPNLQGSNEKIRAATGWQPGIDLSQTLRDVLDSVPTGELRTSH